uniref:hypothetical protein n=1 Tax=Petrachloros mirabilis TaxID=2918835 RepID=UPI001EE80153|nr:hypothetical protein [Petrachloros mirabilis]
MTVRFLPFLGGGDGIVMQPTSLMMLKRWQWLVLTTPILLLFAFLGVAAGLQIHAWGLNWIWGGVVLVFVGWRLLLSRWLKPAERPEWGGGGSQLRDRCARTGD